SRDGGSIVSRTPRHGPCRPTSGRRTIGGTGGRGIRPSPRQLRHAPPRYLTACPHRVRPHLLPLLLEHRDDAELPGLRVAPGRLLLLALPVRRVLRSEEHTSELQ